MPNAIDTPASMTCTTCGAKMPVQAKFCGYDGTKLSTFASQGNYKSCPSCKREFPIRATFCANDGVSLVEKSQEPQEVASAPPATPLVNPSDRSSRDLTGTTLDNKYHIESLLAEGGMAMLYRAHHKAMDREVVIKVIHGALAADPAAVGRFQRECTLAAKINHPNIVSVYDVGFLNGNEPYLVMEYIRGESLAQKLDKQGPASISIAAKILMQICLGLQEAHDAGIIHRDLKTDNILLQSNFQRPDWVKIVDFGISNLSEGSQRLTRPGRIIGTPEYMAPEQFRDKGIDTRLDIYSLGVLLFEILAGRAPFESDSPEILMMKHLMEDPPSLNEYRKDIEPGTGFDAIVKRAMRKEPKDRYQTANEMRLAIEAAFKQLFAGN